MLSFLHEALLKPSSETSDRSQESPLETDVSSEKFPCVHQPSKLKTKITFFQVNLLNNVFQFVENMACFKGVKPYFAIYL